MPNKLGLGERSEIVAVPQTQDAHGNWKTAPHARQAKRWRARASYVGHDGVFRRVEGFGKKRAEAVSSCERRLDLGLRDYESGLTPTTLLVMAGEQWLEHISRDGSGKSERTISDYTNSFRRHVDAEGSSIRGLTLEQANDPQRLRLFLERMADARGAGAATTCKSVLSGIFSYAVSNGVLPMNAARQVPRPRSKVPKPQVRDRTRAMTKEERDDVVAYAAERCREPGLDPRTRRSRQVAADLVAFMAGTGVRIDEARSLRWSDVELSIGRVVVHGTKSESATRALNLPTWLVESLEARASRVGTDGFVFASPGVAGNDRKWEQSNSASAVRAVLDGFGFTWAVPHTFRRTVASLLHQAGIPLVQIADQLGHADPSMTARVYLGRDLKGDKTKLADVL
ncbi:MAG: site-specific integrase [Microbacterium sp.]